MLRPKKGEYVEFKIYEKNYSLFMIYEDFESILVPENNGKQNPNIKNIQANIKQILLVVMAVNYYVLVISLVSHFKHT